MIFPGEKKRYLIIKTTTDAWRESRDNITLKSYVNLALDNLLVIFLRIRLKYK